MPSTTKKILLTITFILLGAGCASDGLKSEEIETVHGKTPLEIFQENVARGGEYVSGGVLVRTEQSVTLDEITAIGAALGCTFDQQAPKRPIYIFTCAEDESMEVLIARWQEQDGVVWVEASFFQELE